MKKLAALLALLTSLAHATYDPLGGQNRFEVVIAEEFCSISSTVIAFPNHIRIGNTNFQIYPIAGTTGTIASVDTADVNHPCAVQMTTGTAAQDALLLFQANSTNANPVLDIQSGATFDFILIFKLGQTALTRFYAGLAENMVPKDALGWMGIRYDTAVGTVDTAFQFIAEKAGVSTVTASGVNADTAWHKFRMRSVVPGTVLMSLDGGAESSFTTNVPTTVQGIAITLYTDLVATTRTAQVDYVLYRQTGVNR